MDFFKSILSDDPESETSQGLEPGSSTDLSRNHQEDDNVTHPDQRSPSQNDTSDDGGAWSFSGLMKTFATKSESVMETYSRDLREFGSGLKRETELFRETASRALKELPASIEIGASVAHGALDGVLKSTAEIISHGKDTLLASSDVESTPNSSLSSRRYSRFDAQLRAIQNDMNTYSAEPEDLEDYNKWKLKFVLGEKSEEVEYLMEENGAVEGIYKRLVPNTFDHDTFWCRYFYRVHKLKQQEDVRANLVKRAICTDDEEELTWDVDDDEEKDEENSGSFNGDALDNKELSDKVVPQVVKKQSVDIESQSVSSAVPDEKGPDKSIVVSGNASKAAESTGENFPNEKLQSGRSSEMKNDKMVSDGKADPGDAGVVSSQPSASELEDLGWDEIEDLGNDDEKKVTHAGSSNRAEMQKRLGAAEEDEDLSWDIEDDV